ncbi:hypothetical protein GX441_02560 [bacterium]|nr:hypothetical protein [bacterium]
MLEKVIRDLPSGYTGFEKVRPFPKDVRRQSIQAITKWAKSWDYTDEHGIAVLGDTLLIVPRRVYGKPYYIDIYDLESKKFVERIEAPGPIIGASNGKLFFADSLTANNAIISVYRFEEKRAYGKVTLNQVEDIRKAIDVESESDCSGESGCCGTGDSYAHVQCSPDKLHKVDTIHTEDGKTVRVVCNYALSPDSIFQFCDGARKNMFVFLAPSDPLGLILLDTLASCLKPLNDWTLTCVICYPAPPDLDFLYGNIPSSQILVNRCVSIPDSTLALTDLGEPPAAIALNEGGKTLIAGYSWAPGYDEQKGGDGISFTEFLEQCAITRHTK